MRIVVIVTEGHPELYRDLLTIPIRQRAERMRTLASMGLYGRSLSNHSSSGEMARNHEDPRDGVNQSPIKRIVEQLRGSLD